MDRAACSKARATRKLLIDEKRFRSKTTSIGNGQGTATRRPLKDVNHNCNIGRTGKAKQARNKRASKLAEKRHNRAAHVSKTGNTPHNKNIGIFYSVTPISVLDFNSTPSSTYHNHLSETTSPTDVPNYGSPASNENKSPEDSRRAIRERAAIIRRTTSQQRRRQSQGSNIVPGRVE
ncbi:hypothetical protein PIB30_091693 [Stylosanthes scabra]|uniref:Uncharacterized protein n=1 Tax=Stylosanthes scabra TaxID=79078 RepID=A0ABU6XVS5_9FABA|nr:hypothetical protein [Stylosanthes scabra]